MKNSSFENWTLSMLYCEAHIDGDLITYEVNGVMQSGKQICIYVYHPASFGNRFFSNCFQDRYKLYYTVHDWFISHQLFGKDRSLVVSHLLRFGR